jgi:hypothetical protein
VDGEPLRIETTLLPKTIPMDMGDHVVETLGSSFLAILDRRVTEFAQDRYAQADDGSVWYFGEDVFDYEDGEIISTEGTWFACVDGPAAMIMAANPKVGQVWRTENVFPVVFEEITVTHTGLTLPRRPGTDSRRHPGPGAAHGQRARAQDLRAGVRRALVGGSARELRSDRAGGAGRCTPRSYTHRAHHPADRIAERVPRLAERRLDRRPGNRRPDEQRLAELQGLNPPPLLQPYMTQALDDLTQAVAGQHADQSRQAALDVMRNAIDFALQYRPRVELDFLRLELWSRQMEIDAQAHDRPGVKSDLVILKWIHHRLRNAGSGGDNQLARQVGRQLDGNE